MKNLVCIVDDDESVRKSLKRLAASFGYEVEAFSSAQSFLDSISPETRGCIILDLRMPGMDGFALQRKLKDLRYSIPVIFITAHALPGDREHAMDQGAIGFLHKPFDEESLLELIEECVH